MCFFIREHWEPRILVRFILSRSKTSMVTPCWCCWRTWMRLPTLTGYAGRSFVNCSSNENLYHPPKSPLRWTCSSSHFMWVRQVLRYYCVIVTCNWLAQKYKKQIINKRFSNRNQNSEITKNHGTMTAGIFVDSICMWMCRIGTHKIKFYTSLPLMSVMCCPDIHSLQNKLIGSHIVEKWAGSD